ncbi:MAG: restriction endonuclease [Clostridia bacterium]
MKLKKQQNYAYIILLLLYLFVVFSFDKNMFVNNILTITLTGIVTVSVIIIIKKYYQKYKKRKKYLNSKIHEIDKMTGLEFEELLSEFFKSQGYKVSLTKQSNDYGADLILQKNKSKIIVQAKRYKNKVGNKAIQEVVASLKIYNATKGMVITNSFYTKNAVNLANANNIILWDRNKLTEVFKV